MTRRCAVYTRKSTEEGLDQAFNSLHAQREACEAFIASQRHEGWSLIKTHFDDGGVSGGTMDRPALQRLLAEIDSGRVDIVVVYKVDRLTRSLADFAKLVERFDKTGASFVSVTQQFNTSNSMGRLTLNVLLSFAQFEREVGAERVRDKIAASRKKGIWTGGNSPLGYDNVEKKLVVNEAEAEIVCAIYALYLETDSIRAIMRRAKESGWVTKKRANGSGGKVLTQGPLYHILGNPLYAGLIRGGAELYAGAQAPIIDRATWDAVQNKRKAGAQWTGPPKSKATSLLAGKIYAHGLRLVPSHAKKEGVRYRYYVTNIKGLDVDADAEIVRLRADEVERAVSTALETWVADPAIAARDLLMPRAPAAAVQAVQYELKSASQSKQPYAESLLHWSPLIERIDIDHGSITIAINPRKLIQAQYAVAHLHPSCVVCSPLTLRRRGQERRLVLGTTELQRPADPAIVNLIERSQQWRARWFARPDLDLSSIAKDDGVERSTASRLVRLAFLAPEIVKAFAEGSAPAHLNAESLRRLDELPPSWRDQRALLGFPAK